jgi:hypothetical protein
MKYIFLAFTTLLIIFSCKNKNEKQDSVFPILSFIKSQVAHVDTSLYQIMKIEIRDSLSDTTYIKREEFRPLAADFLALPDLTDDKYAAQYEVSKFFDQTLNRIVISYTPRNKDLAIQREEVNITPDESGNDNVKTIFIDWISAAGDSTVHKKLLWEVDQGFQVTTLVDKTGQPEKITTRKVNWQ